MIHVHLDVESSPVCAGIGLNVDNEKPTVCLNAVLRETSVASYKFTREDILAAFFNKFETLYNLFIHQGISMSSL